jgi:hypothetical protein
MQHGRVSDATDDAELEARLAAYRCLIEEQLAAAEPLVEEMGMEAFVAQATEYSCERLNALLAQEKVE